MCDEICIRKCVQFYDKKFIGEDGHRDFYKGIAVFMILL